MKNPRIVCILLCFVFISSLNLASSEALIAGKIYNSDFSDTIEGADIIVACNSNTLSTNSLTDGTYAVRFDETLCNDSSNVSVVASKSGFQAKTGPGVVRKCEAQDCEEEYVTIVNLGMKTSPANTGNTGRTGNSGGSSSGSIKYYLCGNNKCDTGETPKTCPKDCKEIVQLAQTTATESANDETISTGEINEEEQSSNKETTSETLVSKILGAVIGPSGQIKLLIPAIFLALILIIAIAVFIKRRK